MLIGIDLSRIVKNWRFEWSPRMPVMSTNSSYFTRPCSYGAASL